MLNPSGDAIYSAGLTEFADLIYDIVVTKAPKGKNVSKFWEKAYKALTILDSLEDVDYLEEEDANSLYSCISEILEITDSSDYPTPTQPVTVVLHQGATGATGATGEKGDTGGGTDFNAGTINVTTVVDSFSVGEAYAARWDYIVNNGAQRTGTIRATWLEDGSAIEYEEQSTADIGGVTTPVTFTVTYASNTISLNAVIASGSWAISGTRYWIPGNGNYIPPVASTLTDGYIWIGNGSNSPVERLFSGVLAVSNTGVTTINPGVIVNADISNTAAISYSKLATSTFNRAAVFGATGKLEASVTTLTALSYVSGVTSSIQTQLDSKQATITGAASTIVSSNLSASVALATNASGKVVDGGITVTEQNSLSGIAGNVQTLLNAKQATITGAASTVTISNLSANKILVSDASGKIAASSSSSLGLALSQTVFEIGDWNMDSTGSISVICAGIDNTKVRAVSAVIRNDLDTIRVPFSNFLSNTTPGIYPEIGFLGFGASGSDVSISIYRVDAGTFDTTGYDSTSYNRGWITITYEA